MTIIIIVFIISILLALFIAWFITRNITRPLQILTLGVKEVGKCNFDKKVDLKSGDEFELLASSFNKILAATRVQNG